MKHCSAIIVIKDGKFLILKRSESVSNSGFWNIPGGKVDENESYIDAGIRELKEEANIDVNKENLDSLGYIKKGDLIIHFYITDEFSGEVKINEESSEYKWVSINEIEDYLFVGGGTFNEGLAEIIKKYTGE